MYYLQLQYQRWNRAWEEWGIPPLVGYVVLVLFWGIGSAALFARTAYAPWLYLVIAGIGWGRLSEQHRVDEIERLFGQPNSRYLRFVEQILWTLPFGSYLLYQGAWQWALGALLGAVVGAFIKRRGWRAGALPTPFGRYPFEFAVGARQSIWMLLLLYILLLKGVQVENGNLSAVSLGGLWVLICGFYTKPEPLTYVWWHRQSARHFIAYKLSIAIGYSLLLTAPAIGILVWQFGSAYLWALLGISVSGSFFIVLVLLGKYTVFPEPMGIPHLIWLVLCISFPPLLLVLLVVFYRRACANLETLL